MLKLEQVSKRFPDGTVALDRVSLDIPRGQFCVLLGPSGSGKSTLLRLINGLVEPTEGERWVNGEKVEPHTLARLRRQVATVHQQFNLTLRMSVSLNVLAGALPATPHWRALLSWFPDELRAKACRLMHEVGLTPEHLHRRAATLSGGQQQRVGIARAFMLDPLVLLADEPVASLDPKTSRDILKLLRHAARQHGTTVLCSLHQPEFAREFADRIVALNKGQLVFDGAPEAFTDAVCEDLYHGALNTAHDARDVPQTVAA
jgi:phosphonate transport system ATP-binding protein